MYFLQKKIYVTRAPSCETSSLSSPFKDFGIERSMPSATKLETKLSKSEKCKTLSTELIYLKLNRFIYKKYKIII